MKKNVTFYLGTLLTALFLSLLVVSCTKEGPVGPEGPQGDTGPQGEQGPQGDKGEKGDDGSVTCLTCHESGTISNISAQFTTTGHYAGESAGYAGGRSYCAPCHSHEQFVNYMTSDLKLNVSNPSAWKCSTCHTLHKTFTDDDYAFRVTESTTLIIDDTKTVDFGDGNLCATCHQSRRGAPDADMEGEEVAFDYDDDGVTDATVTIGAGNFAIETTHWGPHHGPQANILYGIGFAELTGTKTYPAAGEGKHFSDDADCTVCHMGDYNTTEKKGGHTFTPPVATCDGCHTTTSYDYGGVQTDIAAKLDELKGILITKGVIDGNETDGYHPVVGEHTLLEAQAFFNWIGLVEDRSLGVHNPKYVEALVYNTIEQLNAAK